MMVKPLKTLLVGASVLAGLSAFAGAPALAANLTGVTFDSDTPDIRTYRSDADADTESFTDGNVADAIDALQDTDVLTHVELATSDETGTTKVGFSGELGGYDVRVESVTSDEWVNEVRDQWIADFEAAYPTLAGFAGLVADQSFARGGDANIGAFTQDDTTGEFQLDLIGHYNVLNAPWVGTSPLAGLAGAVSAALSGAPLQISEIAKVIIDGEVHYAYSFSATDTGYADPDGSSHSGLYSWKLDGEPKAAVPEPATLLGLMAVGGVFAASKRKSQAA